MNEEYIRTEDLQLNELQQNRVDPTNMEEKLNFSTSLSKRLGKDEEERNPHHTAEELVANIDMNSIKEDLKESDNGKVKKVRFMRKESSKQSS